MNNALRGINILTLSADVMIYNAGGSAIMRTLFGMVDPFDLLLSNLCLWNLET